MTREEQKIITKKKLLDTALNLFIDKGYEGTKIADLSKESGLSVGVMFHYFESKEDLYIQLVKSGLTSLNKFLSLKYDNPLEFFEICAKFILNEVDSNSNMAKMFVFMAQAANCHFLTTELKDTIKLSNIQKTSEVIIDGQAQGLIKEGNPISLASAFWSSIQGICNNILFNNNIPCPEYTWVVDIIKKS